MRCCSTWNEPIGTPNCLRVLVYATVESNIACMQPTASAPSADDGLVAARSPAPGGPVDRTDHVIGADLHLLEGELRGAQRVDWVG